MKVADPAWKELERYLASVTALTVMERMQILERVDPTFPGVASERRREARRALDALSDPGTSPCVSL
jgi:hypothetical protein